MSSAARFSGVPASGLPIGTLVTYNATLSPSAGSWADFFSTTPLEDLIASIKSNLATAWDLEISSQSVSGDIFGTPKIQLVLRMVGPTTYGSPDDVRSIVDGEIIAQTSGKNYIASSNISSFTLPPAAPGAAGSTTQTGDQPVDTNQNPISAITDPIVSAIGDTIKTAAKSSGLTGALSSIGDAALVLMLVVIVGITLLVAYKPASLGRAARGFV